jgi:hypothetical protein
VAPEATQEGAVLGAHLGLRSAEAEDDGESRVGGCHHGCGRDYRGPPRAGQRSASRFSFVVSPTRWARFSPPSKTITVGAARTLYRAAVSGASSRST